ncbi:MAG: carboxypeptidase-like regulatory domain-containing protein [Bacteroidia bacterium]|nr:carboxypeptidase-like regulatory domain-containing protein [Bacteroidia bacterium]
MIRNVYLTLVFLLLGAVGATAQTGAIRGKILDKATKEPLPFASVVAEMNGTQVGGAQSDFDGEYTIKPLQPGSYTLKVTYVGYTDLVITGVLVSNDKITFQDLSVGKKVVETKEVEIIAYKVPLIDKGNTSVGATLTREEIEAAPTRDVRSVASQAAGVFQKDDGDALNVRGSRDNATDYYVDGIRIRGSSNLPQSGVEQVTTIVGGTPAQYGDATGGIISITTRGPSKEFSGGIEVVTSEVLDAYGYNLVSGNLSGPILKKKLENGATRAILGFFISGELQLDKDPDPSAIGMYKLKDDVYNNYKNNPVVPFATGPNSAGFNNQAAFFQLDDFEKVDNKDNVEQLGYRFTAKLDYQPLDNTTLTFGGSFNVNDRTSYAINRAAYNYEENPNIKDTDYRIFGRVTQRIASTYKSEQGENASTFKNVYFTLQAEYNKNQQVNQDPDHKDNFWRYGYFGKFSANRTKDFAPVAIDSLGFLVQNPIYVDNFTYEPMGMNPLTEAYNIVAYDYMQANNLAFNSVNAIRGPGGVRNGDGVSSVMAIWEALGNARNLYQDFDNDQWRFTLSGNADIKKHAIQVGFEFEQRVDRGYSLGPRGLWTLGRQYANDLNKLLLVDESNLISSDTNFVDGVVTNDYGTGYTPQLDENGNIINGFYENLRNSLGYANNQFVDFDALSPDQLNIGMFTPDELIVNNIIGGYYGYDYKGDKYTGTATFKDFFTKKENGNFTREIDAFRPTYMAAYIQDNFAIDNLNFNIGLRVDRFDANQKQLKDRYLLLDAYNVGNYPIAIANKPGNIGNDFVPYIADANDLNSVIGYRDGDVWYDANGEIVTNPDLIAQQSASGLILPAEKDGAGSLAGEDWNIDAVFEDYEPQLVVMPRVAFSFSITDQAQFFAHYDVLTQRPASNLRNDPMEYLALQRNPDGTLNNAGLLPERTTDYEIGFKQVVSKSSAFTISAFYREMKNMIQATKVNFAYPFTYTSYANIDFGTVKGMSLIYDLRRTGNVRMLANYTLQFADGTGSGATSNVELTDTDQPNIRFIVPLDFDTRHAFTVSLDYRYGSGSAYNGPMLWGKPILQNTGANVVFRTNSGTPYTRQLRATREGAAIGWQDNGQRVVEGVINGARTPWQFRIDARIEKDFNLKLSDKKTATLNVYLWVQNVLNTQNVTGVYRATGNAKDDGFINTADGQQLASSQIDPQAFIDQYGIRIQNPDNYSLPRRTRIGIRFDF